MNIYIYIYAYKHIYFLHLNYPSTLLKKTTIRVYAIVCNYEIMNNIN